MRAPATRIPPPLRRRTFESPRAKLRWRFQSNPIIAVERFQAKWTPVRAKKTRQNKSLELRFGSIRTEALAQLRRGGA
jgi:hypothetical protein